MSPQKDLLVPGSLAPLPDFKVYMTNTLGGSHVGILMLPLVLGSDYFFFLCILMCCVLSAAALLARSSLQSETIKIKSTKPVTNLRNILKGFFCEVAPLEDRMEK